MFNSAIKVKDTPKEEKKPVTLTDGKEELNFSLMFSLPLWFQSMFDCML